MVSGFQFLREVRAPVAGLETATEGSLKISGRIRYPLCHRRAQSTCRLFDNLRVQLLSLDVFTHQLQITHDHPATAGKRFPLSASISEFYRPSLVCYHRVLQAYLCLLSPNSIGLPLSAITDFYRLIYVCYHRIL
ncbi:hypothetical protein PoB_007465600 [Plakobranchus ocellatus]|uniref:Uncharacterized protein n=1 Tax=Plakobranchus ocellatus TaxID=259542 RepID=A0AAV4DWC8_9GAST|nr:hypothetical protein PoB_007465600 [Plakobranchus ocellatus]